MSTSDYLSALLLSLLAATGGQTPAVVTTTISSRWPRRQLALARVDIDGDSSITTPAAAVTSISKEGPGCRA